MKTFMPEGQHQDQQMGATLSKSASAVGAGASPVEPSTR